MNELNKARALAVVAHANQTDKAGKPYIIHLAAVAKQLKDTPRAQAVAWLHDILEDTVVSKPILKTFEFSENTIRDVVLLTRQPDLTYRGYIERIKIFGSEVAIAVKLADLRDHLADTSLINESLISRYKSALKVLKS